MLLTLPLVPVFMWLIGSYTADRTRERWQALRALSSHFLDVVRGLPTLRAFGRGSRRGGDRRRGQRALPPGRRWRRSGSASCPAPCSSWRRRSAWPWSRSRPGVRLVDGSLGLQAGLTVIILAPELYLPYPPARRRVPRERGRAGGGRPAVRAARCPGGGDRRPAAPGARAPRARRCASSGSRSHTRPVPVPVLDGFEPRALARRGRGARRRERRRQEHGGGAAARPAVADRRPDHGRRRRPGRVPARRVAAARRLGAPASDAVPGERRRQHPPRRPGGVAGSGPRGRAARRRRRVHPRRCPTATPRWSATGSDRCRRASAAGSGSRGRSCATRRS